MISSKRTAAFGIFDAATGCLHSPIVGAIVVATVGATGRSDSCADGCIAYTPHKAPDGRNIYMHAYHSVSYGTTQPIAERVPSSVTGISHAGVRPTRDACKNVTQSVQRGCCLIIISRNRSRVVWTLLLRVMLNY